MMQPENENNRHFLFLPSVPPSTSSCLAFRQPGRPESRGLTARWPKSALTSQQASLPKRQWKISKPFWPKTVTTPFARAKCTANSTSLPSFYTPLSLTILSLPFTHAVFCIVPPTLPAPPVLLLCTSYTPLYRSMPAAAGRGGPFQPAPTEPQASRLGPLLISCSSCEFGRTSSRYFVELPLLV